MATRVAVAQRSIRLQGRTATELNQTVGVSGEIFFDSTNQSLRIFPSDGTTSVTLSTKGYVDGQIASLINGAPGTLDTLNELATALQNQTVSTALLTSIATKANTADLSPVAFSGNYNSLTNKPNLATKQATLVSGTNIKTINGNSLLGSGDLSIAGIASNVGGSTGAIQFNNNGAFAGNSNLRFDGARTQSIGYSVPLLTTMYSSLAGGIVNASGEVRAGNVNTNGVPSTTAGFARLRSQRTGPVPGGPAGQVPFYGFTAKDNQFTALTFENDMLSSVAIVMGATAPYIANGVTGYDSFGGDGTVFGISGSLYAAPSLGRFTAGDDDEYWRPFLNLDGRGSLTIGGGITMAPPPWRPWFTAGKRTDPTGPAVNCGITFADGTFQNTALALTVKDEGTNVVTNAKTLNFVGASVTATDVSGVATITVSGSSGVAIKDEGTSVVASASTINFVGSGVTATDVSGVATVTVPGGITGIVVQEEGTNVVTSASTINFVGSSVTATDVSGVATVTVLSGGVAVQEEGTNVVTSASTINFVGSGVTASDVSGVATVTVNNGITVFNQGFPFLASITALDFTGSGVGTTVAPGSGKAVVTIGGTVSILSSNITLDSTHVGGTILKWATGDFTITAPSTADGVIPVGATINIFNASGSGDVNIYAGYGPYPDAPVLVGPRVITSPGILSYVRIAPFEQVTLVNLGASAGSVEPGKTMWFCYGSAVTNH